jgi:hypothetical protein
MPKAVHAVLTTLRLDISTPSDDLL